MPESISNSKERPWLLRRVKTKPPKVFAPPDPPPFDEAATWRWWWHIRSDDWWQSQMPISMGAIHKALGIGACVLRHIFNGTDPPGNVPDKLARLIPQIERRALCFTRPLRGPARKGTSKPPKFLWLDPSPPHRVARLCPEAAWDLWARCEMCGGNQFLPVEIDGKPLAACYRCLPPSQYGALGARRVDKSLIHMALRAYYL